jgi:RNA polymerase sigma-70 factor (ECF subfamily)
MPGRPPRSPSDEELACRAQAGCAASFEILLRQYQVPVLQFLRHRGHAADAEDLVQETFVRAYVNLERYWPRWRFATWLFTIARRVSINHHRRARPVVDGEAAAAALARTPEPIELAAQAENRQQLWTLAAQVLSEEELSAVWLYYVEELSAREIAAVLERSWVSVKTMLFRARKKLMPLLAGLASDDASMPPVSPRRRKRASAPVLNIEVPHV